jgi:hypothetical protein
MGDEAIERIFIRSSGDGGGSGLKVAEGVSTLTQSCLSRSIKLSNREQGECREGVETVDDIAKTAQSLSHHTQLQGTERLTCPQNLYLQQLTADGLMATELSIHSKTLPAMSAYNQDQQQRTPLFPRIVQSRRWGQLTQRRLVFCAQRDVAELLT